MKMMVSENEKVSVRKPSESKWGKYKQRSKLFWMIGS